MLPTMKNEVNAAAEFISKFVRQNNKVSEKDLEKFQQSLRIYLLQKFKNHWHPNKPWKGQGYRCLRLNGNNGKETTIDKAASASGLNYADLNLPLELTVWVDPNEVSCRFGEHKGSYCTVASFSEDTQTFVHSYLSKVSESSEAHVSGNFYSSKQVLWKESSETSSKKEEKKPAFSANENDKSKSQKESLSQESKGDHIFKKNISSPQLKGTCVEITEAFPPVQEKNTSSAFSKYSSLIGYSTSTSPSTNIFINCSPTPHYSIQKNLNFHCMSPVHVSKFHWNTENNLFYENQRNAWYLNRRVATV
ncbi:UNVERIFIED_CONTAM: hypothetical protein RMT77_005364 [Armadillidium vulgare]